MITVEVFFTFLIKLLVHSGRNKLRVLNISISFILEVFTKLDTVFLHYLLKWHCKETNGSSFGKIH